MTCDFQQCYILTSVDSEEPVQPPFKLKNSNSNSLFTQDYNVTSMRSIIYIHILLLQQQQSGELILEEKKMKKKKKMET